MIDEYDLALETARRRFAEAPTVVEILSPHVDGTLLELFLVQFCAGGVPMTKPVEEWIRRAARRCAQIGLPAIAQALSAHAAQEADHDLLMHADTHSLVARWNLTRPTRLDAARLLDAPPGPGAVRYARLHEETIAGSSPYAQLAIEYEIERLSVEFGADLIRNIAQRLGPDVLSCLSFIEEHVRLDVGHTKFNRRWLASLLDGHPERVAPLASAGSEALGAYGEFLADCWRLARGAAATDQSAHAAAAGVA